MFTLLDWILFGIVLACMIGVIIFMIVENVEAKYTVTVYDINGEEVAKYTGHFDVEESSQEGVVKIKFDCNGKRHIIYAQTGTVLIDENEADQEGTE